jgi:hypothetical protein
MDHSSVTEPCAQCSAPLADDQRYCLQCGEPAPHVSGPLSVKPASAKPTPLSPPRAPVATPSSARNNSLALLAGVGVLLLAMGVGVLIGRAGAGSAKAPPAQVISLGAAAGGAAGAATTTPTTTPIAPVPTSARKKSTKAKEPAATGSSITKPAPPSAAQSLRSGGSGQSYEQKSKNLPNVVSTG